MSETTVWTMIYAGPHGIDVSVYENKSSATYGAVVVMLSRLQRIKDSARLARIISFIEDKEYEAALHTYSEEVRETFEIEGKVVTTLGTGAILEALRFAREQLATRSVGEA